MRVTKFQGERNLTELVGRIFDLDRSTVGPREIAAAVADANPELNLKGGALATRLTTGELIAVPEIDGAVTTRAAQPLSREAVRAVLRETAEALKTLPEAVTADADIARADQDATSAALSSTAFRRAIRDDARAKDRVKEIRAAAAERAKLADERVDTAEEAIAQAKAVIERMLKRLP
jgi:hypothetical protein